MGKKTNKITKKVSRRTRKEIPELESYRSHDRKSSGRRNSDGGLDALNLSGDYKDILRELAASPTVRYVAGGIVTAILTRLANNWSDKYPEISTFIRDNIDNVESRFGTSRDAMNNTISRH